MSDNRNIKENDQNIFGYASLSRSIPDYNDYFSGPCPMFGADPCVLLWVILQQINKAKQQLNE